MRLALVLLMTLMAPSAHARIQHSYAEPDRVRVQTLVLDLEASFERRTLSGFAELELAWQDPGARTLALDTRDLAIERVNWIDGGGRWHAVRHVLAPRDPVFGSKLSITLPEQSPRVRIYYRTAPGASGLQWLTPAQTQGKRHPFMFSQSQAIHARSWVPLQDTPAVRFDYRARIGAPQGLRAVMSADNDPDATGAGGFRFTMPQKIPSYLLAIAIGELEFKRLGARSGVYAEPARLDTAAREFSDTERMIEVTEGLYGPYRWGRYDMLVLPPSFPYGGMENPRLTFLTPTIIAGDKSLMALVAHELAHSWSGNLVTNAAWSDMWLNEGFTTYVENRIVEAIYGEEQARMQQRIDQDELIEEMKDLDERDRPLVPNLDDRDPEGTSQNVAYTRGAWLLRTLEQRAGRARFDAFVRGWFDGHAFQSTSTTAFLAYLDANLRRELPGLVTDEELKAWLYAPELPASAKLADSDLLEKVDQARADWLAGKRAASALPGKAWTTQEWQHLLNGMPTDVSAERLAELDAAFDLTHTGNAEIAFRWYLCAIRAGYAPAREPMRRFLVDIGRRKLIVPLYKELAKSPENLAWARAVHAEAKPGYHPITEDSVAEALAGKASP